MNRTGDNRDHVALGATRFRCLALITLAAFSLAVFTASCGGGNTTVQAVGTGGGSNNGGGNNNGGGGVSGAAIPSTFFAMSLSQMGQDYPPANVPVGALGHQSGLGWGFVEPQPNGFDFTGYDDYINQAVAHGLMDSNNVVHVTITFGQTPSWAASDTSNCTNFGSTITCPSPPNDINDWMNLVQTVINHYNGVTEPHVQYYELWNEASAKNFWTGTQAQMVQMAQVAFPIIHQDPFSQLLTPSVSGPAEGTEHDNGLSWMTTYLQMGGNKYADGGSFHGYVASTSGANVSLFPFPTQDSTSGCASGTACFGSVITKEMAFRQLYDQNGLTGKTLLDSEGGWGDNSNLPNLDQEAAWLAQWYIVQADFYPSITQAAWYKWGSPSNSGQLETSPGQPSEAGIAYGQVYNWLVGATFSTTCSGDASQTWTCNITRSGGYQGMIVWNLNGAASFTPTGSFVQYRDLAGTVTPFSGGAVTIGLKPILFENQNP